MPRSGLFFTTVTLTTVVLILGGLFAGSYTGALNTSGFYVVAFGVINV